MNNPDIENLINFYKTPLSSIGLWPLQDPSWKNRVLFVICVIRLTSHVFLLTAGVVKYGFEDTKIFFLNSCWIAIALSIYSKYVVNFGMGDRVMKTLDHLNEMVFVERDHPLYEEFLEKLNFNKTLSKAFFVGATGTGVCLIVSELIQMIFFKTRGLVFDIIWKPDEMSIPVFIFTWFDDVYLLFIAGVANSMYDGRIFSFIGIATVQLKILRTKYLEINNVIADKERLPYGQYDDEVSKLINQHVKEHVLIQKFVNSVEETFNIPILCEVLVIMLVMCLMLMNFIINPGVNMENGRNMFVMFSLFVGLGGFCFLGNQLITESEMMRETQYELEWYYCGPSIRKSLDIMMSNSKYPMAITAGKFFTLSNETFIKTCQSAVSYFTVVRKLYEDS